MSIMPESVALWVALVAYVLAGSGAVIAGVLRRRWEGGVLALLVIALLTLTLSIGLRDRKSTL